MKSVVEAVVIIIIVVIGAWLRLHNLGTDSLWYDEAASWMQSKDGLVELMHRTAEETYPPLNNLLIWTSISLFGDQEWALRLPSAILGITNIAAIYWLGSITVGRNAALMAAAFLALSGFHIWYSQEARMYALLSLTATLYAASSFYFTRSPTIPRAALVSLSGAALLYSHAFGAFNWFAIAAAVGFFTYTEGLRTAGNRSWITSNIVAAACFAPWAWLLKQKAAELREAGFWTPYPSLKVVYTEMNGLLGGRLVGALLAVGVALALVPENRRLADDPASRSIPVFLVWAVAPIMLAYAISQISTPVFISRYLIGSLPPLFLVASYGLMRFARGGPAIGMVSTLSAAIIITSNVRYATAPREDWRGMVALIGERLNPSDCVVVYAPLEPLNYYYRKPLPCLLLPNTDGTATPTPLDAPAQRLYFVSSHRPRWQAEEILEELRIRGWSTRHEFRFGDNRVLELGRQ